MDDGEATFSSTNVRSEQSHGGDGASSASSSDPDHVEVVETAESPLNSRRHRNHSNGGGAMSRSLMDTGTFGNKVMSLNVSHQLEQARKTIADDSSMTTEVDSDEITGSYLR